MVRPWYRWDWPEDGEPRVLVDFATREKPSGTFPRRRTHWQGHGVSFETETDPSLAAAVHAYVVAELESQAESLAYERRVLAEQLYDAETAILRDFLLSRG